MEAVKMEVGIRQFLLFLHILLAMTWVGGIMFVGWGVFPATRTFSFSIQRKLLISIMKWAHPILFITGALVITTGVLLGTVFGPLKSWETIVTTHYGQIWLLALCIGIVTLLWGTFIGYFQMMRLFKTDFYWVEADRGNPSVLYRQLIRLTAFESVEVIGFMVLLFLMTSF